MFKEKKKNNLYEDLSVKGVWVVKDLREIGNKSFCVEGEISFKVGGVDLSCL